MPFVVTEHTEHAVAVHGSSWLNALLGLLLYPFGHDWEASKYHFVCSYFTVESSPPHASDLVGLGERISDKQLAVQVAVCVVTHPFLFLCG